MSPGFEVARMCHRCVTKREIGMDYEMRAVAAKKAFIAALQANRVGGANGKVKVNTVAELVGVSSPTVSKFAAAPHRVSENFIRLVSRHVPGMELSYAQYRTTVDEEFVPYPIYEISMRRLGLALRAQAAGDRFMAAVDDERNRLVAAVLNAARDFDGESRHMRATEGSPSS